MQKCMWKFMPEIGGTQLMLVVSETSKHYFSYYEKLWLYFKYECLHIKGLF